MTDEATRGVKVSKGQEKNVEVGRQLVNKSGYWFDKWRKATQKAMRKRIYKKGVLKDG